MALTTATTVADAVKEYYDTAGAMRLAPNASP